MKLNTLFILTYEICLPRVVSCGIALPSCSLGNPALRKIWRPEDSCQMILTDHNAIYTRQHPHSQDCLKYL